MNDETRQAMADAAEAAHWNRSVVGAPMRERWLLAIDAAERVRQERERDDYAADLMAMEERMEIAGHEACAALTPPRPVTGSMVAAGLDAWCKNTGSNIAAIRAAIEAAERARCAEAPASATERAAQPEVGEIRPTATGQPERALCRSCGLGGFAGGPCSDPECIYRPDHFGSAHVPASYPDPALGQPSASRRIPDAPATTGGKA